MKSKFKIDDLVKHIETGEVYKVVDVKKGRHQFFYFLKTEDGISIETPYSEAILIMVTNEKL